MLYFTLRIVGDEPLLMHNARLADPFDPFTKALKANTSKRKRTEEDEWDKARIEFQGSLYFDEEAGPFLPGQNIHRCLVDAAKQTKQGATVTRSLTITSNVNRLEYRGPRDTEGLWDDPAFRSRVSAKVGVARIMRTRPIFRTWAVEAEGFFDENLLDLEDLQTIAERAGSTVGIGDWRPRYGRFLAEVEVRGGTAR